MVETESVSETLVYINHLKRLSAREKIIAFIRSKSFKAYACLLLVTNRLFQIKVYEKVRTIFGDSKQAICHVICVNWIAENYASGKP
jgi:hypothetical protein